MTILKDPNSLQRGEVADQILIMVQSHQGKLAVNIPFYFLFPRFNRERSGLGDVNGWLVRFIVGPIAPARPIAFNLPNLPGSKGGNDRADILAHPPQRR